MKAFINVLRIVAIICLIIFMTLFLFKDKNIPALKYPMGTIWNVGYVTIGLFVLLVVLDIVRHFSDRKTQ